MLNDKKTNQFLDDFYKLVKKIEQKHQMVIKFEGIKYQGSTIKATMTCEQGQPLPYYTKEDFTIGEKVNIIHSDVNPKEVYEILKINKVNIKLQNKKGKEYLAHPQWLQKLS